jgi:hypothetical protein
MKRLIGSFIVLLLVVGVASVSFAAKSGKPSQEKMVSSQETCVVNVIGHIVSIDKVKNQVVVKDESDKQNKVIKVKPEELSKLKVGDVVKFALSASPMAQGVEKLDINKKGK